jgi:phosphatidylserine/phosphatidylglycerophosphate/cardiolipin synthase-like enzyme
MRNRTVILVSIFAVLTLIAIQLSRQHSESQRHAADPVATAPGRAVSPVEGPYFSERDRVAEHIVSAIGHAQKSIHAAIYDFTEPDIARAVEAAHHRGLDIRLVVDEGQAGERRSKVHELESEGISVRLSGGYRGNRSLMHDKFAVFDGRLVVKGSFNWTTSANRYNYENAIFISDSAVAQRYEREFERIWDAGR